MKEATGNALLVMMVTSIIAIIMIFFVGSISYSKSYRIKNRIINEIEDNGGWNETAKNNLLNYLKDVGYYVKPNGSKCPNVSSNKNICTELSNEVVRNYDICMYVCNETRNPYYKVITYMRFDVPVIGNSIKLNVEGETKSFNEFN